MMTEFSEAFVIDLGSELRYSPLKSTSLASRRDP